MNGSDKSRLTSGHGDHCVCNFLSEIRFSGFLEICEHHCADFFGRLRSGQYHAPWADVARTNSLSSPLYETCIEGFPWPFALTENGQCLISRWRSLSFIVRPINRLASNTVFVGFMWNAFLALSPMLQKLSVSDFVHFVDTYSLSSPLKPTQEGVIRLPWLFAMISTRPPL